MNIDQSKYICLPSAGICIAKESSIHGHPWPETHFRLHSSGLRMPTIPEFIAFVNYLKHDYKNRQEAESILDEILTGRRAFKAEWLDAKFEEKNGALYVNSNHKVQGNNLIAQCSEPLEDCLMEDRIWGISLDDWLDDATPQGLPRQEVKPGNLCYWHPKKGQVARFIVDSVGNYLDCDRNQQDSYASLGVFACINA